MARGARVFFAFWVAAWIASAAAAPRADAPPPPSDGQRLRSFQNRLGIDFEDLARHAPGSAGFATPILAALRADPERFLGRWDGSPLEPVSLIARAEPSYHAAAGVWAAPLSASVRSGVKYALLNITVGIDADRAVTLIDRGDLAPVSTLSFQVRASLVDRKTVIEEAGLGWKKTYPVAVGGFDFGVASPHGETALVTPRFSGAWLPRALAARARGGYYKGLPFIRVVDRRGEYDGYAFHIYVDASNEGAPPSDGDFRRGFHSHGCIRMREGDLKELWAFVAKGSARYTPFTASLRSDAQDPDDSPLPLDDASYWSVKNCAGVGRPPRACRDSRGLTLMELVPGRPPIEELDPGLESGKGRWVPSIPDPIGDGGRTGG